MRIEYDMTGAPKL